MALYSEVKVGEKHPFFKEVYKVPLVVNVGEKTIVNTKLIMIYSMLYLYFYNKEPNHWLLEEKEVEEELYTLVLNNLTSNLTNNVTNDATDVIPIKRTWLLDLMIKGYKYEYVGVDYYMLSRRTRKYESIATDNENLKKVMSELGVGKSEAGYSSVNFKRRFAGLEQAIFPVATYNINWRNTNYTTYRQWENDKNLMNELTLALESNLFNLNLIKDNFSEVDNFVCIIEKDFKLKDLTLDEFLLRTRIEFKELKEALYEHKVSEPIQNFLNAKLGEGVKYRINKQKHSEYQFKGTGHNTERYSYDFSRNGGLTKQRMHHLMSHYIDSNIEGMSTTKTTNQTRDTIWFTKLSKNKIKNLINPKFLMKV